MYRLKPLSKDAVPAALAKAERYRLLNEPGEAESICLDVLQVDPDHQEALVMLILALTDQFPQESHSTRNAPARAVDLVSRLSDEYDRHYYSGIIRERRDPAAPHPGTAPSAANAGHTRRQPCGVYPRGA